MSANQENAPSKRPPLTWQPEKPTIEDKRTVIMKQIEEMYQRQEKYLAILQQMRKKDETESWLFAQTILAYQDLQRLTHSVASLWILMEYQYDLNEYMFSGVKGMKEEYERFKREEMPKHLADAFKKGFDKLATNALTEAEKNAENYVV